jgi:hypothetical protein
MPWPSLLAALGVIFIFGLLLGLWLWRRRPVGQAQALARFPMERPALERAFFAVAAGSGKPRGLTWVDLEWETSVLYARERSTGSLSALVGVTVRFKAVPGSDMEGLPAVGNLRNASAVFFFQGSHWHTTGKILFNLNPDEVVERFGTQFERLPQPTK